MPNTDPWADIYLPNLDHNAPIRSRCSPLLNLPHPPTTADWPRTCSMARRRFNMYEDSKGVPGGGKANALKCMGACGPSAACHGSCGYGDWSSMGRVSSYFSPDKLSEQYNELYLEIGPPLRFAGSSRCNLGKKIVSLGPGDSLKFSSAVGGLSASKVASRPSGHLRAGGLLGHVRNRGGEPGHVPVRVQVERPAK